VNEQMTAIKNIENRGPDIRKFVDIIAAAWPGAAVYPPGARFRVRNRDRLGSPIPNAMRGRTGTVISVDGPVILGDIRRQANVETLVAVGLPDVLRLLGVDIEMIHTVRYDDMPEGCERLSHTWMESESSAPQSDQSWLDERASVD
jgi:hypothetical protein